MAAKPPAKAFTNEELGFDLKKGYKVDGRWEVELKLGQGAFGAVYKVVDSKKEFVGEEMALKLESLQAKALVLKIEVAVLMAMKGEKHACQMFSRGRNNRYCFMVMSMLGPSLADMRQKLPGALVGDGKKLVSLSTTVRITFQCLKCIRDMHLCGWLHRDVKPANFAIGPNPENRRNIYIFDFGLARRFRNRKDDVKEKREAAKFRGTMRYCSINGHQRKELGRQDDMISLLYMMVEFIKGVTPWTFLGTHELIMKSKQDSGVNIYDGLPGSLIPVHHYLHSLTYDDEPKYSIFEETLLKITYSMGFHTQPLDWEKGVVEKLIATPVAPEKPLEKFEGDGPGDRETVGVPDLPQTQYKD